MNINCEHLYFEINEAINTVINKFYDNSDKSINKSTLYDLTENYLKETKAAELLTCIFCNLDLEVNEDELMTFLTNKYPSNSNNKHISFTTINEIPFEGVIETITEEKITIISDYQKQKVSLWLNSIKEYFDKDSEVYDILHSKYN